MCALDFFLLSLRHEFFRVFFVHLSKFLQTGGPWVNTGHPGGLEHQIVSELTTEQVEWAFRKHDPQRDVFGLATWSVPRWRSTECCPSSSDSWACCLDTASSSPPLGLSARSPRCSSCRPHIHTHTHNKRSDQTLSRCTVQTPTALATTPVACNSEERRHMNTNDTVVLEQN